MAFFRFNRDKRGYEYFYLVEPTANRRGKVKSRILYWYRTPPGVRVGREPFDEEVRRALEAKNPGITFDWRSIVEAPIPSADADKWRERRRAERAAKYATASAEDEPIEEPVVNAPSDPDEPLDSSDVAPDEHGAEAAGATSTEPPPQSGVDSTRKRRRRRRGRRLTSSAEPGSAPVGSADAEADEPRDDDVTRDVDDDRPADAKAEPADD
jgi:hypothetical protein